MYSFVLDHWSISSVVIRKEEREYVLYRYFPEILNKAYPRDPAAAMLHTNEVGRQFFLLWSWAGVFTVRMYSTQSTIKLYRYLVGVNPPLALLDNTLCACVVCTPLVTREV